MTVAAYNFQKQFVPLIESGEKSSTIRKRRANGYVPRAGEAIRLYTGMRTKACKLIREVTVVNVTPITIYSDHGRGEVVNNLRRLDGIEIRDLAIADGFKSVRELFEFFNYRYGPSVQAYLIRWAARG